MTAVEFVKKANRLPIETLLCTFLYFILGFVFVMKLTSFSKLFHITVPSKPSLGYIFSVLAIIFVPTIVGAISSLHVKNWYLRLHPEMNHIDDWIGSGHTIENYPVTWAEKAAMADECKLHLEDAAIEANYFITERDAFPDKKGEMLSAEWRACQRHKKAVADMAEQAHKRYIAYFDLVAHPKDSLTIVAIPLWSPNYFREVLRQRLSSSSVK